VDVDHLQLDRLDFRYELGRVVTEKRRYDLEHGIAEAADIQDIGPIRRLRRDERLHVDANQLRAGKSVGVQPDLVRDKRLPLGRRCRRQESNLVLDLRGVACGSSTLRGQIELSSPAPCRGIEPATEHG
jgi:hypothetical protein